MLTLTKADTKGTCHLAYDAVAGEKYIFPDKVEWKVLRSEAHWSTGFKAIVIRPLGDTKDITVLSFAGTDSILDALVDITQAVGLLPPQYLQALLLTIDCRKEYRNLYLTGHSLGGGLAAYASVFTKTPASTINPAPLVGAMTVSSLFGNEQITNYIPRNREIVSSLWGRNPGIEVKYEASGNFLSRHKMVNVMVDIPFPQKSN